MEIYRGTSSLLRAACGEHAYAADAERLMPAALCVLRRGPRRYGWALGAALAACVVGFVGGAQWANWPESSAAEFVSEVADYHAVFARENRHLVEVPADRMDEITSWLGQRLNRPLTVPDLSAEGLRFAGARMLVVSGQPVAEMMYTRAEGRPLALCIAKLGGGRSSVQFEQHKDQRTAMWRDGAYTYVVVGEIQQPAIQAIAADVARQIHS